MDVYPIIDRVALQYMHTNLTLVFLFCGSDLC